VKIRSISLEELNRNGCTIEPDFIYNRFDLYAERYGVLQIADSGRNFSFEYHFLSDSSAELSLWLVRYPPKVVRKAIRYLFQKNPALKTITYRNSLYEYGIGNKWNHFQIELPNNPDKLLERLSSKDRYNRRREAKILELDFGSYCITEYSVESAPDEVLESYYRFKKLTHHINYDFSAREYMRRQCVSTIYALTIGETQTLIAVLLSCEQCAIVYLENLTYDTSYAKYSPGKVLYNFFLQRIIEKGKEQVFLLGGILTIKNITAVSKNRFITESFIAQK